MNHTDTSTLIISHQSVSVRSYECDFSEDNTRNSITSILEIKFHVSKQKCIFVAKQHMRWVICNPLWERCEPRAEFYHSISY